MTRAKTNLLFVTPCFEEGGGERFMVNLFANLDTDRFAMILLSWRVRKSHFIDLIPPHVRHIDLGLRERFRYELPGLIWKMRSVLRRERPDIIVCMLNEWHIVTLLAMRLSGLRPALILEEQGGISCWLDVLRKEQSLRAGIVEFLYKHVYLRCADMVICCSNDVARDFDRNFGADRSKLRPILNPLDTASIESMAKEDVDHPWFNKGLPIVIGVGRLTPHKGNRFLVQAFARVNAELPARLIIVADGPERPEIEKLIEDLGIKDVADILGYRSNPFKYLARSTVFVCPSLSEGCPYVVEEALAVGTPVVATRCTGSTEILQDGKCGLLVPQEDVDALAQAILRVLKDKDLQQNLSRLGRQRAQDFSVKAITREYERAFSEYV
ncbi:MAG: glycosyltransferase [Candidatus Eisenbacteria bacterium]